MSGLASTSEHIPSPQGRDGSQNVVPGNRKQSKARSSKPRMKWDKAHSRSLECCTVLVICLTSVTELQITMDGLAPTSTIHSKPLRLGTEKLICGASKATSDCQAFPAKNDMGCSHAKAPGVLHNPFDMYNESQ